MDLPILVLTVYLHLISPLVCFYFCWKQWKNCQCFLLPRFVGRIHFKRRAHFGFTRGYFFPFSSVTSHYHSYLNYLKGGSASHSLSLAMVLPLSNLMLTLVSFMSIQKTEVPTNLYFKYQNLTSFTISTEK